MPDIDIPEDMLATAKTLCLLEGPGRPGQADLRRATSTAYYAVFNGLSRACADALAGASESRRSDRAWLEVYRSLNHGTARDACKSVPGAGFPAGIEAFSKTFNLLQAARHSVDYDPLIRLKRREALGYVAMAEKALAALGAATEKDRVAFAAWVLLTGPGVRDARRRARSGKVRQVGEPPGVSEDIPWYRPSGLVHDRAVSA